MLDEASTLELFPGVRRDIVQLSLASWFAELTEAVCPEEAPAPELASLLLNGLYALCYLDKDPALVKTAFQWRLMALAGFQPFVDGCAVCGAEEPAAPMLTKEQFERELNYRVALSIARQMREGGLVTPGEFVQIDRFLRRKFSPVWGGLYQNNP